MSVNSNNNTPSSSSFVIRDLFLSENMYDLVVSSKWVSEWDEMKFLLDVRDVMWSDHQFISQIYLVIDLGLM